MFLNYLIRLEEVAMTAGAIVLTAMLPIEINWWWYLLLFFTPDIGMVGYLVNTRVGAFTYNLLHHKGIAICVGLFGLYLADPYIQFAGLLLFGHASFDRIFGFGLKHSDDFKHTHLGWMK